MKKTQAMGEESFLFSILLKLNNFCSQHENKSHGIPRYSRDGFLHRVKVKVCSNATLKATNLVNAPYSTENVELAILKA